MPTEPACPAGCRPIDGCQTEPESWHMASRPRRSGHFARRRPIDRHLCLVQSFMADWSSPVSRYGVNHALVWVSSCGLGQRSVSWSPSASLGLPRIGIYRVSRCRNLGAVKHGRRLETRFKLQAPWRNTFLIQTSPTSGDVAGGFDGAPQGGSYPAKPCTRSRQDMGVFVVRSNGTEIRLQAPARALREP